MNVQKIFFTSLVNLKSFSLYIFIMFMVLSSVFLQFKSNLHLGYQSIFYGVLPTHIQIIDAIRCIAIYLLFVYLYSKTITLDNKSYFYYFSIRLRGKINLFFSRFFFSILFSLLFWGLFLICSMVFLFIINLNQLSEYAMILFSTNTILWYFFSVFSTVSMALFYLLLQNFFNSSLAISVVLTYIFVNIYVPVTSANLSILVGSIIHLNRTNISYPTGPTVLNVLIVSLVRLVILVIMNISFIKGGNFFGKHN